MSRSAARKQQYEFTPEYAPEDTGKRMSRYYSNDKGRCFVTFTLPAAATGAARMVTVAGTFNDWSIDMDAYERVLTDAMAGDATLFARQDHVEEA